MANSSAVTGLPAASTTRNFQLSDCPGVRWSLKTLVSTVNLRSGSVFWIGMISEKNFLSFT